MTNPQRRTRISVAVPGPWWSLLTYEAAGAAPVGVRVRVPVGRGFRVGLVAAPEATPDAYQGELRPIEAVLDERPVLDQSLLKLLQWFCETYLCGFGTAMKTLLPAAFLQGEAFDVGREKKGGASSGPCCAGEATCDPLAFLYEPIDGERFARYRSMLADGLPTLVAFPQHEAAKRFFDLLQAADDFPAALKARTLLFPKSGAKAEWRAWSRLLLRDEATIVIGAQSAATAPVKGLRRVIVEDESNHAWRTQRSPIYNVRSLLAKRAQLAGAALALGGRLPSSRAFMQMEKQGLLSSAAREKPKKMYFVDLKLAYSPAVKGVQDTLAVSEPLVRETEAAIAGRAWALWILDRKGYAGEILCEECGTSLTCARCGGAMRWEASADCLCCVSCSARERVPDLCPHCRGRLLQARRPGLEALLPLARAAMTQAVPVLSLTAEADEETLQRALSAPAGLLIGTRAALSFCDRLHVGMVGWIDADGEARSRDYDARVRAFGLVWESCWRGRGAEERPVLLQTRRPGKGWQRGLTEGWPSFWRAELEERRTFDMPPYVPLIRVEASAADTGELTAQLDAASVEYWVSAAEGAKRNEIWIRTRKLAELRRILTPLFHIRRARRGFPAVTVWHE